MASSGKIAQPSTVEIIQANSLEELAAKIEQEKSKRRLESAAEIMAPYYADMERLSSIDRIRNEHFAARDVQFDEACKSGCELFRVRNRQYNDAISETGVIGVSVELIGVVARLKGLVLHNPTHGRDKQESLRNVAIDLHNYANILAMMLDDENWEGK
jgi:hypothetical protein